MYYRIPRFARSRQSTWESVPAILGSHSARTGAIEILNLAWSLYKGPALLEEMWAVATASNGEPDNVPRKRTCPGWPILNPRRDSAHTTTSRPGAPQSSEFHVTIYVDVLNLGTIVPSHMYKWPLHWWKCRCHMWQWHCLLAKIGGLTSMHK